MKDWNNITIEEYQLIYGIITDESINDLDKEVKLISIVNELTESEVDNLSVEKFKELKSSLQFLHDGKIQGRVKRVIKANGREYQMSLDAFKITYGQYVDITSFMSADGGLIGNIHLVLASMAMPVKRHWLGFKYISRYGDTPHNEIATDMLKSNFADCYHTAIFFCKLINDLTKVTAAYSVREILREKKITKAKLKEILKASRDAGAGFIMPSLLEDTKVSN